MTSNFEKVQELTKTFKLKRGISEEIIDYRLRLLKEEYEETLEALDFLKKDLTNAEYKENALKEILDLTYLLYGTIDTFGWDADSAFAEVHASNMSKLDDNGKPLYHEGEKIRKSKNYRPANMEKFVK